MWVSSPGIIQLVNINFIWQRVRSLIKTCKKAGHFKTSEIVAQVMNHFGFQPIVEQAGVEYFTVPSNYWLHYQEAWVAMPVDQHTWRKKDISPPTLSPFGPFMPRSPRTPFQQKCKAKKTINILPFGSSFFFSKENTWFKEPICIMY